MRAHLTVKWAETPEQLKLKMALHGRTALLFMRFGFDRSIERRRFAKMDGGGADSLQSAEFGIG